MLSGEVVYLIFALPILSFIIILAFLRPLFKGQPKVSSYLGIALTGISFVLSLLLLLSVYSGKDLAASPLLWLNLGGVDIKFGAIIDGLVAIMLMVVTFISLLVQIYSVGYMRGDPGYHRYFALISLFTGSMIGLVMASNLFWLFSFWELVGLCSYLLIGFWFDRPAAASAAKKAFIVTRVGDFGLLGAVILLFTQTGTLDIGSLHILATSGALAGSVLSWATIGILMGAMGKSAQFPLHVWLPDAMEGPTPVSALIHAATMVAAGVFLIARMYPLFEYSPNLKIVAIVGGFTAIFAATMALVMTDIKRVLAYSTISQLGYMLLGLGVGGVSVGIFHLFNHAFFKALLFLGAGNIGHATATFDMRQMGGLGKKMPWTFACFVVASLSLAGIYPLSGFWSKDEIISSASEEPVLFYMALVTVFFTAFYMFRTVFMTFSGSYRGKKEYLHESHKEMVIPIVILAALSVFSGFFNLNGGFAHLLGETDVEAMGIFGVLSHPAAIISLIVALLGIFLAYAVYKKQWLSAAGLTRIFYPFYILFSKKYWIDTFYEDILVRRFLVNGVFKFFFLFDRYVVDGLVNGAAKAATGVFAFFNYFDHYVVDGLVNGIGGAAKSVGKSLRHLETGQLQLYGAFIILGVTVIVITIFLMEVLV